VREGDGEGQQLALGNWHLANPVHISKASNGVVAEC
jgi:hypothetical protein